MNAPNIGKFKGYNVRYKLLKIFKTLGLSVPIEQSFSAGTPVYIDDNGNLSATPAIKANNIVIQVGIASGCEDQIIIQPQIISFNY